MALTIGAAGYWTNKTARDSLSQAILDVVPGLLGFSIGAMAILLAFSHSKFFTVLSEEGKPNSAYLDLASKFVHFILVQAIAITTGVLLKAYSDSLLLGILASFFLMYAIMTAAATGLTLFGMAEIYNKLSGEK